MAAHQSIAKLDLEKVGLVFVNLVATSAAVGHKHIWHTVLDYVHEHEGESLEAAFVREAFQLPVSDAAAKWFLSTLAAQTYIVNAVSADVAVDWYRSETANESPQDDVGFRRSNE